MSIRTVILCGGKGTRAFPHSLEVPKPLMDVAGEPILGHVMAIYAEQGFADFVLLGGYKCEMIREFADTCPPSWKIDVVDTGEGTPKGERVLAVADRVGEEFFVTYGDGVGDVDLAALLAFHRSHAGVATMTTVPLPSPYGTVDIAASGAVGGFLEKPALADHPINAGFFVFDHRVFDDWPGGDLETDVLPTLSGRGELFAYQHDGFWESMDTYKDSLQLTALCEAGDPPWRRTAG